MESKQKMGTEEVSKECSIEMDADFNSYMSNVNPKLSQKNHLLPIHQQPTERNLNVKGIRSWSRKRRRMKN
jgi:hypothetical protein